ncbi:MAG: cbb3-type cytochrome oxidase assembly protein CcoS [Pseudomonadota bacterium]
MRGLNGYLSITMEILYLLIPLAVVLISGAVALLFWAVKNGQFEDLEGPAHRILWDDDEAATLREIREQAQRSPDSQGRSRKENRHF